MVEALRLGDRTALARASLADASPESWLALPDAAKAAIERCALVAIRVRQESVALISDREAYVRKTRSGSLRRTVGRVTLSLADRTLWQPAKSVFNSEKDEWESVPLDPAGAALTYDGYCAINAIAGCVVTQPANVMVDGELRTNPFVERVQGKDGRPGDIVRIVIASTVAGAAPATGNIVLVSYKLDYDPSKDLLHMIAAISKQKNGDKAAFLCSEDEPVGMGWKFLPLHAGIGYAINLREPRVTRALADFVNILHNATKKAQTVARRNAMRNHPAFSVHNVRIVNGSATVPVVGWAMDEKAQTQWVEVLSSLASGQRVDPTVVDVEAHEVEESYEPGADGQEGDEAEGIAPMPAPVDDVSVRNSLIATLDDLLLVLEPSEANTIRFDASTSIEELQALVSKVEKMVKGGAS